MVILWFILIYFASLIDVCVCCVCCRWVSWRRPPGPGVAAPACGRRDHREQSENTGPAGFSLPQDRLLHRSAFWHGFSGWRPHGEGGHGLVIHLLLYQQQWVEFWRVTWPGSNLTDPCGLCGLCAPAALHSVFPPTELGAFMVLLKNDKEQQLDELVTIVTGIRLFNKACRTGAEQSDLRELSNVERNTLCSVVWCGE